jgi:head-tail adaptor
MTGAGEFRYRIRFDKQVETPDPAGGSTYAWSTLENGSFERWAAIKFRTGSETVIAQRLEGQRPVTLSVRRDSETVIIDASWRAVVTRNGIVEFYAIKSPSIPSANDNKILSMEAMMGAADA